MEVMVRFPWPKIVTVIGVAPPAEENPWWRARNGSLRIQNAIVQKEGGFRLDFFWFLLDFLWISIGFLWFLLLDFLWISIGCLWWFAFDWVSLVVD